MTAPAVLACAWFVAANVLAMLPSRDEGRRRTYALIVAGVPLLGWLTAMHGPTAGVAALALGVLTLRCPLVRLWRRMRDEGLTGPAE